MKKLIIAAIIMIVVQLACGAPAPTAAPAAPATSAPVATAAPATIVATALSSSDSATATAFANCYHPEQIDASMIGESVCVRGIIKNFTQDSGATRYSFSDQHNTFFVYSRDYEVIDPNTGKTLTSGTCIEVNGTLKSISGVPYIDIQDLLVGNTFEGLYFYSDPSSCTW